MKELLAHLTGDYLAQTGWMATNKTSRSDAAAVHAVTYAACFLPVTHNWKALALIGGTHFAIDRWRLVKRFIWARDQIAPSDFRHPWDDHVSETGFHRSSAWGDEDACSVQARPAWLGTALMIVSDNAIHMLINRWALGKWSKS